MVSLLSLSVFCVLSALGCTNPFGIHCPICFPGLSSVGGKRLFPATRVRFDIQVEKPNKDGLTLKDLVVIELALAIREGTDRWSIQRSLCTVDPVLTPEVGLRVIETEGRTLDMTGGIGEFVLIEVCLSLPNLSVNRTAFELYPGIGTGERIAESPIMDLPTTNEKVEIMLTIAFLVRCGLLDCRVLPQAWSDVQQKRYRTQQVTDPGVLDSHHCFSPRGDWPAALPVLSRQSVERTVARENSHFEQM